MSEPYGSHELIVDSALSLPPEERGAFIDGECAGDLNLRQLVEALLRAHKKLDFLPNESVPSPLATMVSRIPPLEKPGDRIGRYTLVQQIGEGAFGVVYAAEQQEPVRRMVALKIIKLGMDTKAVVSRFEAERQTLALMDHHNIAKVLDAGSTDNGRPYFVMELVRGIRITDYCDQHYLSIEKRLELFIHVCEAIQHAHQKGIIHRDIKPSNILVSLRDGITMPKVIDFGIAKATERRLTHNTLLTTCDQFIGTPAYMSPEQADLRGLDIDTRSDIYSLGVLLYELLSGTTPFDVKELLTGGLDNVRRTICEKEPISPSTRLRSMLEEDLDRVVRYRQVDGLKLMHRLRGDLDWIVMKCLEKDRARRYATANGLTSDIRRHLANEAVEARPSSTVYRFRKFVLRNKLLLIGSSAAAIILLLGTVVSAWQAVRATRAEREQRSLRADAENARRNETRLRHKAELSDASELAKLWESYLAQARANRLSGRPGRRLQTLDVLKKAAALRPSLELRNEAIACLALSDMRVAKEWQFSAEARSAIQFDSSYQRYAKSDARGRITLCQTWGHQEIISLTPAKAIGSTAARIWFSPNGRFLAAYYRGEEHPLVIWDLLRREPIMTLSTSIIRGITFSPDKQCVVVAHAHDDRHWLSVFDLISGVELKRLARESGTGHGIAFNAAGDRLAVTCGSQNVEIWDAGSWKIVNSLSFPAGVNSVAWHPNGKDIAVAAADTLVYVCDVTSKKMSSVFTGHHAQTVQVGFNHAGDLLYSVSWDGNHILWDLTTSQKLFSHIGLADALPFSVDDRWLGYLPNEGGVGIWEALPSRACRILRVEPDLGRSSFSCAFCPDGQLMASSHRDGMRLWDTTSAREIAFLEQGDIDAAIFDVSGHSVITSGDKGLNQWPIKVERDGKSPSAKIGPAQPLGDWLEAEYACLDETGEALSFVEHERVHRLTMKEQVEESFLPESTGFDFAAISPDGRLLAAAVLKGDLVRIWASPSGQIIKDLRVPNIGRLCFSPDSKFLVTASADQYTFWETASWTSTGTIRRQTAHHVKCGICFTPDGLLAAINAPSADVIRLIDPVTLQEYATLESPLNAVITGLCFSPDGTQLAASTHSRALQLWNLRFIRSELAKMNLDWPLAPYPPVNNPKVEEANLR